MIEVPDFPYFPSCLECGGKMELARRSGRTREIVKGVHLPIPSDFPVPTCQSCGEEVWAPEMSDVLDPYLTKQVGEILRGYVDVISERHDVTQSQIGTACRVGHTYLSHVAAGRKTPSGTLVELLSIFAEVDGAFEHAFPEARRQPSIGHKSDGDYVVTTPEEPMSRRSESPVLVLEQLERHDCYETRPIERPDFDLESQETAA
jgi:hypothetical protein